MRSASAFVHLVRYDAAGTRVAPACGGWGPTTSWSTSDRCVSCPGCVAALAGAAPGGEWVERRGVHVLVLGTRSDGRRFPRVAVFTEPSGRFAAQVAAAPLVQTWIAEELATLAAAQRAGLDLARRLLGPAWRAAVDAARAALDRTRC